MKIVASLLVLAAALFAVSADERSLNSTTSLCNYEATCNVGGIDGVCVSISAGCCNGGTVTSGLCPGSSDIRCCTNPVCNTPSGSGVCKQQSACGTSTVAGYCSGPSDLKCCLSGGSGCRLGDSHSSCDADSIARGLSNQIIAELNSMGYKFRGLDQNWVRCPGCTLQSSAADALEAAARSKNDYITLNSAFRTSAEQYLLYKWYGRGQCWISLAAPPGGSNHEGGRAIDTSYYSYWAPTLAAYGYVHSYPSSDPVHFDYMNAPDLASKNLLAFQRLWNRYNSDKLDEDGIYGPATESALSRAPCNGW